MRAVLHFPLFPVLFSREEFYRLDTWEDDSRRRRRFVPNPYGSAHAEATLRAAIEHGAPEEEVAMARKAALAR